MALLQKTESRLPAIYPEVTGSGTNFFNSSNADLLGFHHLDGDYCLVSYLPASIKTVLGYLHLQNHYVVFINGTPGTDYDYSWSVNYEFDHGIASTSYSETEPSLNKGTFQLDALNQGLAEANIPNLKQVRVSCEVRQGSNLLTSLELTHRIYDPDADVLALSTANGQSADAGNIPTTHLVSNIVRDYFPFKPSWQDAHTVLPAPSNSRIEYGVPIINPAGGTTIQNAPPLNYPAAILYARMLKSSIESEKKNYFPPLNTEYYTQLNNGNLNLQREVRRNLVGPCVIAPHFAALCLGKLSFNIGGSTNFVHIGDNNGTDVIEQDIFDAFNTLPEDEKIDIYNLARFPKSAFVLSARMMTTLFEKAVEKNHTHFRGGSDDISDWNNDIAASVDIDDYARNIYFEYFNGPQEDIGTFEMFWRDCKLKKAVGKVHGHDYSSYITRILDRGFFTGIAEVKKAYFARRKVATNATGQQSVSFEPISQSVLGRQEYVIVETDNVLAGQAIRVSIKTGDTRLTGTAGETLTLIENGSPQANFTATVGAQTELMSDSGTPFTNAGGFAKFAIFKIGLRADQEAIFNSWNANIPADGSANAALTIEVQLNNPPADTGVSFGENPQGVYRPDTTHTFLTDSADTFRVGHLDKTTVPRIRNAYFAKKVATLNSGNLTVEFERITEPTVATERSYIIGRSVYVVLETQNLRGRDFEIYVQTGNNILTGSANDVLLVAPMVGGNQPTHFTAQVVGTGALNDDALHDNAGNNPYTNMATHADKVILKINLRPSGPTTAAARTIFDTWCGNIQRNPTNAASIELRVKAVDPPQDQYVYFGEQKFEEEMRNGSSQVFLKEAGQRFSVENSSIYEIHHLVAGPIADPPNPPAFTPQRYNKLPTHTVDTVEVRRPIGKINNESTNVVTYFFFDAIDNEHEVCRTTKFTSPTKQRQIPIPLLPARGALNAIISYAAHVTAGEQIYAQTLSIYENGTLGIPSTFGTAGGFGNRWYANIGGDSTMIDADIVDAAGMGPMNFLGIDYNNNTNPHGEPVAIAFNFRNTRRRSANPDLFAGFLGSLAQLRDHPLTAAVTVRTAGFSYEDGSSYPSVSHVNGNAVDTAYLANVGQQNLFVAAMRAYGIRGHGRGNAGWQNEIVDATFLVGHNDHLHSFQFNTDFIHTIF